MGKYNKANGFTREELVDIWERIDECPRASEAVTSSYEEMNSLFDDYLNAIQEDVFVFAYQLGYNEALKTINGGGAA